MMLRHLVFFVDIRATALVRCLFWVKTNTRFSLIFVNCDLAFTQNIINLENLTQKLRQFTSSKRDINNKNVGDAYNIYNIF